MVVKKNILITGRPRVGKSTIIKKVVERLRLLGCTKMGGCNPQKDPDGIPTFTTKH